MLVLPNGLARIRTMGSGRETTHSVLVVTLFREIEWARLWEIRVILGMRFASQRWGRPAYKVLRGINGPGPHLERNIFDEANSRNLPHTDSRVRQQGRYPISGATGAP